jgi:hypothetical protein
VGVRARSGGHPGAFECGVQQPQQVAAAAERGVAVDVAGTDDLGAEPVAGPFREEGQRGGGADGEVALLHPGGAEVHAGAGVQDDPGGEFAVGEGEPDMRAAGAGGGAPVHPAYVVHARDVRPGLGRIAAGARQRPRVLTLQQTVGAAAEDEPQMAQGLFRGQFAEGGTHAARPSSGSARSTCCGVMRGGGTAASTSPTI